MRPRSLSVAVALALVACAACTLTTDLTGLASGEAPATTDAATPEGGGADAALDAALDVGADAGSDADSGEDSFSDDFTRPDNDALGNGWTEKLPGAFTLERGAVRKLATPATSYQDNMVYRPASEDRRDVEASVEVSIELLVAYPQVFVRAQRGTLTNPGEYDGYVLYIENSRTSAKLGRQRGKPFVAPLATLTIAPALDPAARYRLRLSARGTLPVKLDAFIERKDAAAATGWTIDAEAHVEDSDPARLEQAGAVGFSANEAASPTYDNFGWRALPAGAP